MKALSPIRILGALIVLGALLASPALAQKSGAMSTPIIACGAGTTGASIHIEFTAGSPTGAPAGFSLQWMSLADFEENGGWYLSSDPRLCKGSFSGNAFDSRYNLSAGQSPIPAIRVGDMLLDNGASTNCNEALVCGTKYVFRAFSHASSKYKRSDWTPSQELVRPYLLCQTLACAPPSVVCPRTQGYWQNHGPLPNPGNQPNVWPVTELDLGNPGFTYSDVQLKSILQAPVAGNGLIKLAHQLIAAKLNVANGVDPSAVTALINAADAMIGTLVVPPVGSGTLPNSQTSGLTDDLADWNEGKTGPLACRPE